MALEWFAKLKEYDSLSKMRLQHLKIINEQEERLNKLQQHKSNRLQEVEELKAQYMNLQHEINEIEKKIKTASEQKQRLLDYGGDELKIKNFSEEITQNEAKGFELLEALEQNELQRAEAKEFLAGLEKTMHEIGTEVASEKKIQENHIQNLDLRLKLLLEELPSEYRQVLEKILQKNLAHGPFTRVEQGSCFFCRAKLSRIDESEIDMQKKLKTCTQCSRLFIPYGT